jgi:bifunctional ADP-heptose synthase (sugar kinase/adenylyltransferase)
MLQRARELAGEHGRLVAGILTDEAAMERKPRPTLPFEERAEIASAIRYIDEVVPQRTYSPSANVTSLRPDVLIESDSHLPEDITAMRMQLSSMGGKVIIIPYFHGTSSTQIKGHIRAGMEVYVGGINVANVPLMSAHPNKLQEV